MNTYFNSISRRSTKRLVSTSLCGVLALAASLGLALATSAPAGAATPTVQGTACTFIPNLPCHDTITGNGFTPGAVLNVEISEFTGLKNGAPQYEEVFATQTTATLSHLVPGHCVGFVAHPICTPSLFFPGGTFTLTFTNSEENMATCGETATFLIAVQQSYQGTYARPVRAQYRWAC
jgi:hypothetical protein